MSHRREGEEARCSDRPSARATPPLPREAPLWPAQHGPEGRECRVGLGAAWGAARALTGGVGAPRAPVRP